LNNILNVKNIFNNIKEVKEMERRLLEVRDRFISTIGDFSAKYGFSVVAAQIWALLFFSERPLSLGEIAEILGFSKASISTNVRLLERYKCVKKVYIRGDRKSYYEGIFDYWEIIRGIISTVARDEIKVMRSLIEESEKKIKDSISQFEKEDKDTANIFIKRIDGLREYYEGFEDILNAIEKKDMKPVQLRKIIVEG
jgi:DNA-binding transcriptional regulator GbsR (MarR family)